MSSPQSDPSVPREVTLDPDSPEAWAAFRALAHQMVDDMLDHFAGIASEPAWKEMPPAVRKALAEPIPVRGIGADAAYRDFVERVLPYPNGNLHPRFWGWVQGTGTPIGMMADMLASGLNPNVAGFNQAPALVEDQVIAWLAELMGMPSGTSGLLVTGGSMANILALAVARYAKSAQAGLDVREDGLFGARSRLLVYGSSETHTWVRKAVELLGMGRKSFRPIPVDAEYRIEPAALEAAVAADRAAGHLPICVIGTAGTVNTGATDDLAALADFCQREKLWFHVDGAFGAWARLSPRLKPQVRGMERADSLAFDLHKWGYLPFECASVLVRDPAIHREAFAVAASYLAQTTRGVNAGGHRFADRGVDLTRGFKALKVWLSFKAHGVAALARLIDQNVDQARHLVSLVSEDPDLELLAPAPLNVVCFRFAPEGVPVERLDLVNEEILLRLQERGIAVPSGTRVRGQFAIRVANTNHRSRRSDFEVLASSVVKIGHQIVRERRP